MLLSRQPPGSGDARPRPAAAAAPRPPAVVGADAAGRVFEQSEHRIRKSDIESENRTFRGQNTV
eukprot:6468316-Heterocapsa_arctica.AAC.1